MQKTALRSLSLLLAVMALILSFSACDTEKEKPPRETESLRESQDPSETEDIAGSEDIKESEDTQKTECQHELMFGVCLLCKKDFSGSEGLFFISNGDGTCRLAGIDACTDTDIIIPSYAPSGDAVVEIGYRAFAWNEEIRSVTIPKSITVIQKSAFHDCLYLKSVTFEGTKGWTCNGVPVDVTDPSANVRRLLNGDKWEKQ